MFYLIFFRLVYFRSQHDIKFVIKLGTTKLKKEKQKKMKKLCYENQCCEINYRSTVLFKL